MCINYILRLHAFVFTRCEITPSCASHLRVCVTQTFAEMMRDIRVGEHASRALFQLDCCTACKRAFVRQAYTHKTIARRPTTARAQPQPRQQHRSNNSKAMRRRGITSATIATAAAIVTAAADRAQPRARAATIFNCTHARTVATAAAAAVQNVHHTSLSRRLRRRPVDVD